MACRTQICCIYGQPGILGLKKVLGRQIKARPFSCSITVDLFDVPHPRLAGCDEICDDMIHVRLVFSYREQ